MSLLRAGDALVTPYCARCDLPVERISYRVPQPSIWAWEFQVQCCGATRGHRLSMQEILRISTTGEKFWAVTGRGHVPTIKKLANLGVR